MKLRPCSVYLFGKVEYSGHFHKWASGSATYAIVEDKNGRIHNVPPERLKFTDKENGNENSTHRD